MRIKAVIAYDGSAFHGFQKQSHTKQTVATAIESALKNLKIESKIVASGRTDRGVHATGQIIHFDIPPFWNDVEKLKNELNRKLQAIKIKHIVIANDMFHARFDVKKRLYRYYFTTKKPSIFMRNYLAHYDSFDKQKLTHALSMFKGEHDFNAFCKTGSTPTTTIRTISKSYLSFHNGVYCISFEADGFLRSQVRMMVSAAMKCAQGEFELKQLQEQLDDEQIHFTTLAPPEGLYLSHVFY
ncbi:MAG: tRNA pseudouridine(38-40) synthase TruA [Sulfurovaceae bacterium]|nr:tRNA pseudouridine(38-40) synthase TruA [Sulfurovaceae bacterium]